MYKLEIIQQLKSLLANAKYQAAYNPDEDIFRRDAEALEVAIAALRPVSRERVEQTWSGRWIEKDGFGRCSACGWGVDYFEGGGGERFCSGCGRAMTDEAVDIVLSRLEALKDAGN
ncbi:MAG TPA: hypothetical protein IAC15_02125 [Candidatus Onthomonas avicola]|nr:hypothetical protein [Candidatus Onthomonas avicola]